MINTSRFLTNQLIIDSLTDPVDKSVFEEDQKEIREWLLQRLRRITCEDFIEYNSKPYQRLSIAAILNLYDFAKDDKLRDAARIVLDFASAKFAVGSNLNRRVVPFRRRMEENRDEIWGPSGDEEGVVPRRLFDLGKGSDHQAAAMLFFTGQTQQLPTGAALEYERFSDEAFVSRGSVGQMMWEATSSYVPHRVILDLAMAEVAKREKERRRKSPRPVALKRKILESKRRRAELKKQRTKIKVD